MPDWTPINKKWPKAYQRVLAYTENDTICEAYISKYGQWYGIDPIGKRLREKVIAWMPRIEYRLSEETKNYNYGPWMDLGVK